MKNTYYCTTVPLSIGKLQPGNVLDGEGYPTFQAAQAALIAKLYQEIQTYKRWTANNLLAISKVVKQKGPF